MVDFRMFQQHTQWWLKELRLTGARLKRANTQWEIDRMQSNVIDVFIKFLPIEYTYLIKIA